jgi:hypothetical protein
MAAKAVALLSFALALAACDNNNDGQGTPIPIPPGGKFDDNAITPEIAGFGDAPLVEFAHYFPPAGCTFDPLAAEATCDVSGCSVPNLQDWFESEEEVQSYLSCGSGMAKSTGIDFSTHDVLFVRQGMRVGEWMRPEPVAWVVDVQGHIIVAEKRRAFCITGSSLTGGVVSYGLLLPSDTSSTAVERRIYRNPHGCDMCGGDSDCGE